MSAPFGLGVVSVTRKLQRHIVRHMLELVVNADDFGLSEAVNEGIKIAHLNGIVTSASVMANGAAFDHAIRICHDVPTLDIGVHLALVEGRPVLEPREVTSLVTGDGRFYGHALTLAKRYIARKVRIDQVRAEIEAQVEKVLDHGVRVTHLDGHQHAHMLPAIFRVTVDLARKYRIPFVRVPSEKLRPYMLQDRRAIVRLPQLGGLKLLSSLARDRSALRVEHFEGFVFGGRLTRQNLMTLVRNLPSTGTCELMCHPGMDDLASSHSHWGYRWSDELEALLDKDVADALQQRAVVLTSFRDLF